MSRFVISKNIAALDQTAKIFDKYYKRSKTGEFFDCNFAVWKKNFVNSDNYIENNDGLAFYTGTLEYLGKVGADALGQVFNDFTEQDFPELLKKLSGCFAIIIKKFDKFFVFVDPLSTFKVYFTNTGVGLSNNLYGLACAHESELSVNKLALLEQSFQYSVLGSETMLKGISKLQSGDLYIYEIGCDNYTVTSHDIFNGELSAEKKVTDSLKNAASRISEGYSSISINMTGGLDSRLVLSSFLAAGCDPTLFYGVGDSAATNTKSRDKEIVCQFSKEFGLDFNELDWSLPDNFVQDWSYLLAKYGEYFTVYLGNSRIVEQYEKIVPNRSKYTCFGYFGETFRNIEPLEAFSNRSFDTKELVDNLYLYHGSNRSFLGKFKDSYRDNVLRKINEICQREGLDVKRLTKNEFQRIHSWYRSEADAKMSGFMNSIGYSSVILSDFSVQSQVRHVSYSEKRQARYQLGLIASLAPSVMRVPLFSHGRNYNISRSGKIKQSFSLKSFIKKLPVIGIIGVKLKVLLSKKLVRRSDEQYLGNYSRAWINSRINELQNVLGTSLVEPEKFEGDIRALVYYLMNLYLLSEVFKKDYSFPIKGKDI